MCQPHVPSRVTLHSPESLGTQCDAFGGSGGQTAEPGAMALTLCLWLHRRCARTRWSSPWRAATPARLSGRRVWSTMPSSGCLKSPSQSPKPFCAAKAPVSATGKVLGENQTAGIREGVGRTLSATPPCPALYVGPGLMQGDDARQLLFPERPLLGSCRIPSPPLGCAYTQGWG